MYKIFLFHQTAVCYKWSNFLWNINFILSLKYIWPQNLMSSGYPLNLKGEHLRGKAVVYWTFNKPKEVFRWKRKILCNFGKNLNHFFFFLEKSICILLKIGVVLSAALSPIISIRVLDLIVTCPLFTRMHLLGFQI